MLLNLLLIVAAIPGATNPRTLVLGPKVNSASEDVRLSAVAKLAEALEDSKLMTRRLSNGNLIDFKEGTPESAHRSHAALVTAAGCEQGSAPKSFVKHSAVLERAHQRSSQRGRPQRVARGIGRDGVAQRLERSTLSKVDTESVNQAVELLGKNSETIACAH